MEFAEGDAVRGRYTLAEHLGEGGFSTVWRAHDSTREREVALKLPSFEAHDRETVFERFERERDLLEPFAEGLSHATVVRYLDGDLDGEPPYIALEYLAGEPLSEAFGTESLGTGVRRRLATDLAGTLDFIHRNDVVYLDLKPENVIVRRSGRPVLLDFNTAFRRSEGVETVFGADQFKAPELLVPRSDGEPVGAHSDVFSWGKLAFYLLTGARVETADVPAEGLDPRTFGSTCSRELAGVIRRATKPEGDERYGDGTALAGAVARATGRSPRLVLDHPSGVSCAVADGDTVGCLAPEKPVPWVVLPDPEGHVSPRHARFERSSGRWMLTDTSLNGTYVTGDDGWSFALGESGYRTRLDRGEFDPDGGQPPATVPLSNGAIIAPVHPEYGIRLRVRYDEGSTSDAGR